MPFCQYMYTYVNIKSRWISVFDMFPISMKVWPWHRRKWIMQFLQNIFHISDTLVLKNKFDVSNTKKCHIDVFKSRINRSGSCVDLFSSHDWSCDHNTRLCYQADQPTVWRLFSKFYYSIASGDMSEGFIGKIMKMTDVLVPNKFTVSVRNFFRSCKRPALKNNGVSFSKMADETNILQ